jgi:telomere length regulation protein
VRVLRELRVFEIRSFTTGVLRILNANFATSKIGKFELDESLDVKKRISKAAAFLRLLSTEIDSVADILLDTLTKPDSATILLSPLLVRAIFASLLDDEERLDLVLERSIAKFSDELFVKHGTILQQEMNAQLVLIAVGHFHRNGTESLKAESLKAAVKSSEYLNGVSKHLSSSSTRVRWLGMVVATTISGLADKKGTRMEFNDESMSTPEAEWYKSLALVDDERSGSWKLSDLFGQDVQQAPRESKLTPSLPIRQQKGRHEQSKKTIVKPAKSNVIEVIDDDIVAYAKPDSDPEDEEDDPTLINRDKPRPPV